MDIYGKVRRLQGDKWFIPFLYQGQYYDVETELAYNRFRYYSPDTGAYISQDPIGLAGGNPTLYGYVKDTNMWVDIFGLDSSKLNQALGGVKGDGMSAHHLIPETVYDKYQAFFSTLEIERDDRYNGLLMPSSQKKAVELGDVNMIVHLGGHPEYIKEVEKSVSKYSQDFNKGLMDKKEATDKIRELQNDLRIDIINKKKRVKSTPCGGANTLA